MGVNNIQESRYLVKNFTKQWTKFSFGLSFSFFVGIELLNSYFTKANIYHDYWTDTSLAGFCLYSFLWRTLRTSNSILFTNLPLSIRRARAKKYCMLLVTANLIFEIYLEIKRKKLLLSG